jgi:glycosyltransferase involved in cell wall biosynthesis
MADREILGRSLRIIHDDPGPELTLRVGLTRFLARDFISLEQVYETLALALRPHHQVAWLPDEYHSDDVQRRREVAERFVRRCDVILGVGLPEVVEARNRVASMVPCAVYPLGQVSRGGQFTVAYSRHLRTNDVLLASCSADLAMFREFFADHTARLAPFSYADERFGPSSREEVRDTRRTLGLGDREHVLLYAGRLFLEKNLHTLLRVFSAVNELVPDTRLVLAGELRSIPFHELGPHAIDMRGLMAKLLHKLHIPPGHVHILGRVSRDRLRRLYGAADVAINLTLHHDENFGYSQVEAMACGTPVVGTCWGGLKDTILDGVTGYHVSTLSTPIGVKVDWWDAVNQIVRVLLDPSGRTSLSVRCSHWVQQEFSVPALSARLEQILLEARASARTAAAPLRLSSLGEAVTSGLDTEPIAGVPDPRPQFQRSGATFSLYRRLVAPYTGLSARAVPPGKGVEESDLVIAPVPIYWLDPATLGVDDPIYPFEVEVPTAHRRVVAEALDAMAVRPVMGLGRVAAQCGRSWAGAAAALAWMLSTGLLLRVRPDAGPVGATAISARAGVPVFGIRRLSDEDDILVFGHRDFWKWRAAPEPGP